MKSIKVLNLSVSIILVFIYGISVGRYELFPFKSLQFFNRLVKQSLNKELSNNELLAELAKNNNIELKNNLNFSKGKNPLNKSHDLKFISYGDIQPKDMKGLLGKINMENSSLIVHVGDTQISNSPCTESLNLLQYDLINSLNAPVLYTPGDNEWLDCHDKDKGNSFNLERLDFIRKTYFSNNLTLGKNPLIVENQKRNGYPENARLMQNNVVFITTHIVGGNNNFDPFSKKNTFEYLKRNDANIDWITKSFKKYNEASAFIVIMHANIFSTKNIPWLH